MFGPGILSVRGMHAFSRLPFFALMVFVMIGSQHKRQRKMLLSGFSVAAMRGMTPTFYEIAYKVHTFWISFMREIIRPTAPTRSEGHDGK